MAQPVPLDEATELYNEAMRLGDEIDSPVAARLAFRLRRAVSKQPMNFLLRVALAHALLHCAEREQALRELDAAWRCRDYNAVPAMMTYSGQLGHVGAFSRLRELVDDFWRPQQSAFPTDVGLLFVLLGLSVGDLSLLSEAAVLEEKAGASRNAVRYMDFIEASCIGECLAAHQEVVFSVVGKHQLWCAFQLHQDEDSDVPVLQMTHRVDVGWPEARRLRREMNDALYGRFQGSGVSPAFLCHDMIPVPRTPVFQVA